MPYDQIVIHSINRVSGIYTIHLNFDNNVKWTTTGSRCMIDAQACLMSASTIKSSRMLEQLQSDMGTFKIELSDHPTLQWEDEDTETINTGNIIRECFESARENGYLVHAVVARYSNAATPVFQEFVFAGSSDPREKTVQHRRKVKGQRRIETISCEFNPAKRLDVPLGGDLSPIVWTSADVESNQRPKWLCVVCEPGQTDGMKPANTSPETLSKMIIVNGAFSIPPTSFSMDLAYGSHPASLNHDCDILRDNVGLTGYTGAFPAGNWTIKLTSAINKLFNACNINWDGVIPSGLWMREAQYNQSANIYVDEGDVGDIFLDFNYVFGFNPYDGTSFKSPVTFDSSLMVRDFQVAIAAQLKSRIDIYAYDADGLPIARFVPFGEISGTFPDLEELNAPGSSGEDAFITDKDGVIVTRRGFEGSVTAPANAKNPVAIEIPFAPYAIGYETTPTYDASRLTPNPKLDFQDQWKCGFRGAFTDDPTTDPAKHNPLNPDGWAIGGHLFRYASAITAGGEVFPASHDDFSGGVHHDGGSESVFVSGGWTGYVPVHAIYDVDPGGLSDAEKKERQKNFLISYALYFGRYIQGERGQLTIQFKGVVAPNWTDVATGMSYIFQPLTSDVEYVSVSVEKDILEDVTTVTFEESAPDTLYISSKASGDGGGTGSVDGGGSTKGGASTDSGSLTGALLTAPNTAHRNLSQPTATGIVPLEIKGFDTASHLFDVIKSDGTNKFFIDGVGKIDGIWFLPNADGSAGELLGTDASGNLGWYPGSDLSTVPLLLPTTLHRNKIFKPNSSTIAAFELDASLGGTSNLLECYDGGGTLQTIIDSFGEIVSHVLASFIGGVDITPVSDIAMLTGEQVSGATNSIVHFKDHAATKHTLLDASHNLGIGLAGTNVDTKLQVNGNFSTLKSSFAAVNGANNNCAFPANSYVEITAPNAAYQISGITGGKNGAWLILHNRTGQVLTIQNKNAGSLAANRIDTLTGGNLLTAGDGAFLLIYNSTTSLWTVSSWQA